MSIAGRYVVSTASHARRRAEGALKEERCAAPAGARRLRRRAARCRRRRLAARQRLTRRRSRLAARRPASRRLLGCHAAALRPAARRLGTAARRPGCSLLLAVGRGEVRDDDGAPPRDKARQRAWFGFGLGLGLGFGFGFGFGLGYPFPCPYPYPPPTSKNLLLPTRPGAPACLVHGAARRAPRTMRRWRCSGAVSARPARPA